MKTIQQFGTTATDRIQNAISKLQEGKGVLLVDDENRENEGDIIYPTQNLTEQNMALMIRECSGIVCLCITQDKADSLDLKPMVEDNTSQNQTAFTSSIEAKVGVSTGVSAKDRVTTIKAAAAEHAVAGDLARPGHVFPLIAKKNGVLERRGHTEGSIDLIKIAGLGDSAVLCELTNEDGTMSRLPEVIEFAEKQDMMVLSIEDICEYRYLNKT
jgi:3,4-dihydroxy 2-butanone 4-phosphate synthase